MVATKERKVSLTDRITLTTEELAAALGCGRAAAVKTGEMAKAQVRVGRRVFYNVAKIRAYIDGIEG